jgi:hypothetical protein
VNASSESSSLHRGVLPAAAGLVTHKQGRKAFA